MARRQSRWKRLKSWLKATILRRSICPFCNEVFSKKKGRVKLLVDKSKKPKKEKSNGKELDSGSNKT